MRTKKEFLTVGEMAKQMGTTVRTLQYYDKEGLLKPSAFSEGGRRLYSAKDIVKLHQILSFKYLGFSLEEIKSRLFNLDQPREVAIELKHQKKALEEQIAKLQEALRAINLLHDEVEAIQQVDFSTYAEIIGLLREGNPVYWIWKYFDEPLKNHVMDRFGDNPEAALRIMDTLQEVTEKTIAIKHQGEPPESEAAKALACEWWDLIMEFTGGDMSLISCLEEFNNHKKDWNNEMAEKQQEVAAYLGEALEHYFAGLEEE